MSKNVKISNPMKVITGVDTRWSYANVWEPKSINGGTPKYSVSLIIPKSDTKTIAKIEAAIEAAYKEGEAKLKGNGKSVPALSVLKTPLRDGDAERPDDEAYKNAYFVNANATSAPGIVDADLNPILTRSEVYSGVYGRASITFYAFNSSGNKGIACGLNNLQKIRDGEPLGGKASAESDFATDDDDEFDAGLPGGHEKDVVIPEGSRNATMSRFAGIVIKKYGDTAKAYQSFLEKAAICVPPLDNSELNTIWHSAQRFYSKISREDGYVPPEVYNDENSYKPEDFSDVGQAEVLSKYFANELRYSPATHFIRYSDHYWQETEPGAQAVAHELTRRQLAEANRNMMEALQKLKNCGAQEILDNTSKAKAEQLMSDEQMEAYQEFLAAKAYQSFAVRRRDSKNITSTLKETHPMLEISPRDLDADCFLLCTPEATYDLRKGMAGAREHSADDFITKITSVSPGSKGAQLWQDNLDLIFQKDQQLIDYVQMICGLAAIGKVFVEALIIAYGDGRNGKSTFWNAISRVLGLYSGNISADTLTVGCRRNIKPEMAEVKGKRLLIAAEMQEGARLNDSTVKQLCSTDDVFAEKKYKDPFSFKPCHTLVLYTNHLPRVSASDDGIWRRLIVIPFNAKIEGKADIKNYGEYLYENAGESILAWIIEGAKKVIALDYQIPVPDCVTKAIDEYRSQNDWFGHFLEEKCDVDESFKESSSALYQAYRNYSLDCNEYVRSTADFYFALEKAGFERLTLNRKRYFKGLKIHDDNGAEEDFLQ